MSIPYVPLPDPLPDPLQDPLQGPLNEPLAPAPIDAVGPTLPQMLALFGLCVVLISATEFVALLLITHVFRPDGPHTLHFYAELLSTDARFLVPIEAAGYGLVLAAAVPLFRTWWQRPFARGVHWNVRFAGRRLPLLVIVGLGCGFGIALLGSVLPMPKNPPISADIMHSPTGAWMMLLFGITGAPLFEELVFRGFLLPAFLNVFRWLQSKGDLSAAGYRWVGVPLSILLTSLPFALLHAPQVAHAWGPLLLIGLVSIVLCVIRLALNSLAASTVIHAAYNFTLFAGILVQTGGFRHLNRLIQ